MTDNGLGNAQEPGDNQEDDTTCIAQRDSTRPMPVTPPQEGRPPQSTWSGAAGATPVGASAGQAPHPSQAPQPSAPHPTAYPSAPQQGWAPPQPGQPGPPAQSGQPVQNSQPMQQPAQPVWNQQPAQGYPSAPPPQPSAPQYGGASQPFAPPPGQQYGSAPQGGPTYQAPQQNPWAPGQPQQQFSAGPQQPGASAPYGQAPSSQPPARAAATHHLTPLEKFGPLLPALLLFIAAFLTWATFTSGGQSVSLNGVGSNSNGANPDLGGAKSTGGWLTIVLALGLAGIAGAAILGKVKATIVGAVTTVLSVLAVIIGLIQFANISSVVNSEAGTGYSGKPGIGVWLTLFASLVGLGLGVAAMTTGRKRSAPTGGPSNPGQSGPFSTAPGQPGQPGQPSQSTQPGPFGQPNQQV